MHPKLPSHGGICEGFAVELTDSDALDAVVQRINEVMGPEWTMQSFGDRNTEYQLRKSKGKLGARSAWEKCYGLRAVSGVAYAEPLFATVTDNQAWATGPNAASGDDPHLPESLHPEWSFDAIHAREAWIKFFPNASRRPGHGIVIGHPDTGYSDHPELEGRIVSTKGYDFLYDDPDAHDDLERPLVTPIPNPGHGTGTASAIVSPQGSAGKYPGGGWVTGVAPGAEELSLRRVQRLLPILRQGIFPRYPVD